jgi:MFS family permease
VMVGGVACFAGSFLIYGLLPGPAWLIPARVLHALGSVATFGMGAAYLADAIEERDRGSAIGLYTAAMGTGFAVGPLIGGSLGAWLGFSASYQIAAVLGAAVAVATWLRLQSAPRPQRGQHAGLVETLAGYAAGLRKPEVQLAGLANVLMQVSVSGAILTFFPIYAVRLGVGTSVIGVMFAARAFASALGRLPAGIIAALIPVPWLLVISLVLEAAVNVALWKAGSPTVLAILLVVEGIGFGVFTAASMGAVASASAANNRGAAMGFYGMAGSLGESVGSPILGLIAELAGPATLYAVTAVIIAAGVAPSALIARRTATRAVAGLPAEVGT